MIRRIRFENFMSHGATTLGVALVGDSPGLPYCLITPAPRGRNRNVLPNHIMAGAFECALSGGKSYHLEFPGIAREGGRR